MKLINFRTFVSLSMLEKYFRIVEREKTILIYEVDSVYYTAVFQNQGNLIIFLKKRYESYFDLKEMLTIMNHYNTPNDKIRGERFPRCG